MTGYAITIEVHSSWGRLSNLKPDPSFSRKLLSQQDDIWWRPAEGSIEPFCVSPNVSDQNRTAAGCQFLFNATEQLLPNPSASCFLRDD
jgi:hypothetical protein